MSILVSGSLVYDHIMNFPDSFKRHIMPEQIHILNVCFVVNKLERSWGGTAGNIAYTMRLLGAKPLIVSAVGKDGKEYCAYLKKQGISDKYISHNNKQLTASAYITTDADDNQITAFYGGHSNPTQKISISKVKEKINLALVSPTRKDIMIRHMEECAKKKIKTVFDPGQQITVFSKKELQKMISLAHFVIGNDYEVKLIQKITGWDNKKILNHANHLIITLGERGSLIMTRNKKKVKVGVCKPKSLDDPTGAGDAYRAGFFTGYENGLDLKTCGQIGAVASSYAIETYGTQEHFFTKSEFCERYKKSFNEELKY